MWLKTAARVQRPSSADKKIGRKSAWTLRFVKAWRVLAARLARVYGEAAARMLRQFGRACRIDEDVGQL
jgi:hypothetical protein